MAILKPDKIITINVGNETLEIKQKIIPDTARASKYVASHVGKGDLMKPCKKLNDGSGKPRGITIHNTRTISVAAGTNPAEQYTRATWPNCNMSGVVVHYYVWKDEIWQNLKEDERGWHAADGSKRKASQRAGQLIGGNLDTIAIEVIETGNDAETEKTAAILTAYLLDKHSLSPDFDVYQHKYFSGKNCPEFIIPRWGAFKNEIKSYYEAIKTPENSDDKLWRVQVGAYKEKKYAEDVAKELIKDGYPVIVKYY